MSDWKFRVHLDRRERERESRYKYLQNSLPQSSAFSPILFNGYTYDLVYITSQKCMYADNVGSVTQSGLFKKIGGVTERGAVHCSKLF